MSALLIPPIHSYFAIYTLEGEARETPHRGLNWDLHATATDRGMAISHARKLALQPGVSEVQVKQVTEDRANGTVRVRDVVRCRRSGMLRMIVAISCIVAAALAVLTLP